MKTLFKTFALLALLTVATVLGLRLYFGGAAPYKDLTSAPSVGEPGLYSVLEHPDPVGSIAITPGGRMFFTAHPAGRPDGPRVFEWRDGGAQPFPAADTQASLLATPTGLAVDRLNRLWIADPAHHGLGRPRIVAIDLDSGLVVHEHVFPREIAPRGSFLHDLEVAPDGRTIYIADAGFLRKSPALVVYDAMTRNSRRLLEAHGVLRAQGWLIRTPVREMRYLGGQVAFKPGLHGLSLDSSGEWLYFAAMAHDTLYRVPTQALRDPELPEASLGERVEAVGDKPLSDQLATDGSGGIYVTDVEHGAVLHMRPDGQLTTVVKSPRIRWADSLAIGPDGWVYVSDSALPEVMLAQRSQIEDRGPYHVFRFRGEAAGAAAR